jgi:hypothetical protein
MISQRSSFSRLLRAEKITASRRWGWNDRDRAEAIADLIARADSPDCPLTIASRANGVKELLELARERRDNQTHQTHARTH